MQLAQTQIESRRRTPCPIHHSRAARFFLQTPSHHSQVESEWLASVVFGAVEVTVAAEEEKPAAARGTVAAVAHQEGVEGMTVLVADREVPGGAVPTSQARRQILLAGRRLENKSISTACRSCRILSIPHAVACQKITWK